MAETEFTVAFKLTDRSAMQSVADDTTMQNHRNIYMLVLSKSSRALHEPLPNVLLARVPIFSAKNKQARMCWQWAVWELELSRPSYEANIFDGKFAIGTRAMDASQSGAFTHAVCGTLPRGDYDAS